MYLDIQRIQGIILKFLPTWVWVRVQVIILNTGIRMSIIISYSDPTYYHPYSLALPIRNSLLTDEVSISILIFFCGYQGVVVFGLKFARSTYQYYIGLRLF